MNDNDMNAIRKERDEWESVDVEASVDRMPETTDDFRTISGLPVRRLYDPTDIDYSKFVDDVGYPGRYPYTRGIHPTMHRARAWTRRQVVGVGDAASSNERHNFVIGQGQTGLSTDFDLPTLTGLDSDDPRSAGEVGRVGVAIDSSEDMGLMLRGIDLAATGPSFQINHPAVSLFAMYVDVAQRGNTPLSSLRGTIQNEPLNDLITMKNYVYPAEACVKLAADIIEFSAKEMPKFNPISIRAYNLRDSGATADQEIGFAFALAIAYLEEGLRRGLSIDTFAPRFSWIFYAHNEFLEEVAKFRAARRLWARLMRERFGATNPGACQLRIHVQTGGATLTAQEPELNLVRGGFQALSAVLGGIQSMALSTYDEAYANPSEKAQRLALHTQELIEFETGVTKTVDPLAGSYVIESLTDELETQAAEWIDKIDAEGGATQCSDTGYIEQILADQAYRHQLAVSEGTTRIVGVNHLRMEEDLSIELFEPDARIEAQQKLRLAEMKGSRDGRAVLSALHDVEAVARGGANVVPALVEAVKLGATEGETTKALTEVYGEHVEKIIF